MGLTIIDTLTDSTQKAQATDAAGQAIELETVGADKALKVSVIKSVSSEDRAPSAALTQVTASASSVSLLAANASRRGLMLFNNSTKTCYVAFAATASASAFSIKLPGGALYEKEEPIYTGAISAIWDAANGQMQITELS